jgi:uncharacterized protein
MRVAITGASGFVGSRLAALLAAEGHAPVALTRDAEAAAPRFGDGVETREVDPYDVGQVAGAIEGCDGVVNLAGESLFAHRWTRAFRRALEDSRVESTRALVTALATLEKPPEVLVSGSAVGWYGPRDPDEVLDEDTLDASHFAPEDLLGSICHKWERMAREAERSGVRVVRMRTGVVLDRGGGALAQMERPFKLFVGGRIGSGKQVTSWIHRDDLCRMFLLALEQPTLHGPMNGVAPNPVTNAELSRALAHALGRPCWLPVPPLALRVVLGEVASIVATGQRVVPKRALDAGFRFEYPTIDEALAAIYAVADAR